MILCPALTPVTKEHENDWFVVNNRGGFFTIEPRGKQVAILVLVNNDVILVRVNRPVINDCTWELPAGGCELNENEKQGAIRELKEETGISISPDRLISLDSMSICPNRFVEPPYIFAVEITELEWLSRQQHDDEVVDVCRFSLLQIQQMLLANQIYVALPALILAKLLLVKNHDVNALTLQGKNTNE